VSLLGLCFQALEVIEEMAAERVLLGPHARAAGERTSA
jgi:hypothetical protein